MSKCYIQPSEDFTQRTMSCIEIRQTRKELIRESLFIITIFTPFVVRQAWLLMRSDYFSVERMPMASYILGAYRLFLSPHAMYFFAMSGLLILAVYMVKTRKVSFSIPYLS